MCVIITVENGKFPTKDTLKSAESLNSDGGAIAWLNANGTRSYVKGISSKKMNKIIEHDLKPRGINTAIIHFRIASVGKVIPRLCHPFEVKDNSPLNLRGDKMKCDLLFHNGTWSDAFDTAFDVAEKFGLKLPQGEYSDSRIMAILGSKLGIKKMAKLVDGWNKIAVLTDKGIVKYGSGWVKHKGNTCSNDYFVKTNDTYMTRGDMFWGINGHSYASAKETKAVEDSTDFGYDEWVNSEEDLNNYLVECTEFERERVFGMMDEYVISQHEMLLLLQRFDGNVYDIDDHLEAEFKMALQETEPRENNTFDDMDESKMSYVEAEINSEGRRCPI